MIRNSLKAIAFLTVLGGTLLYIRSAIAQPGALQFIPLAQGFSPDRHIRLHADGPSNVLQARLVLNQLGEIGWHTHPGPVVVVVTQGALTQYHSNGCVSVHQQGSVFFESDGEVHKVVNHSDSIAAEAYATFILPEGRQPLEPAPAPRSKVCAPKER